MSTVRQLEGTWLQEQVAAGRIAATPTAEELALVARILTAPGHAATRRKKNAAARAQATASKEVDRVSGATSPAA